jgi:hypothetical protein
LSIHPTEPATSLIRDRPDMGDLKWRLRQRPLQQKLDAARSTSASCDSAQHVREFGSLHVARPVRMKMLNVRSFSVMLLPGFSCRPMLHEYEAPGIALIHEEFVAEVPLLLPGGLDHCGQIAPKFVLLSLLRVESDDYKQFIHYRAPL